MSTECIHGLDEALCDVCHPVAAPTAAAASKTAARGASGSPARGSSRSAKTTRSTSPRTGGTSGPASRGRRIDLAGQRVYHLTHIDNLTGILAAGKLLAAGAEEVGSLREVDIASAAARRRRSEAIVDDRAADSYVPFFLTPDARLWRTMRLGVPDGRLDTAGGRAKPYEFVMLVGSIRGVSDRSTAVLTDGDVTLPTTRVAVQPDEAQRMLSGLHANDGLGLMDAELLVAGDVPLERLTVLGVVNDGARRQVRDLLSGSSWQPKVAVYPPWFQAPVD